MPMTSGMLQSEQIGHLMRGHAREERGTPPRERPRASRRIHDDDDDDDEDGRYRRSRMRASPFRDAESRYPAGER